MRGDLSSMRSSTVRSSPFTGSVWCSAMWASIRRFSKTLPLFRDATGTSGETPEIAQSMMIVVVGVVASVEPCKVSQSFRDVR